MSSRAGWNVPNGHGSEPHARGLRLGRCRAWLCCWLGLSLFSLSGCSSWLPELVPFGSVNAPDQFRSINGLGVHRRMWESAGVKVLTPLKLSPRLDTVDTIVLVGQSFSPPGRAARDWLERWLGDQAGRSVIYFGRDFNADVYYRQATLSELPAEERRFGEMALAQARAVELTARCNELPESTFCNWFYLDVKQRPAVHRVFQAAWSADLAGLPGDWPTGVLLQPPGTDYKSNKPSWLSKNSANSLQPASELNPIEDSDFGRSIWQPSELDTDEAWDAAFEDLPDSETLLAAADGTPLVFRLTHRQRFSGSQLLIVANGAPFLNGSLVMPLQQRIAEKLIDSCLPAERVALLAYADAGLLISAAAEADPRGAGLEMFTVWPLSAITVPALLLGLVACAMLLPSLGRPQRLAGPSVSDFGLHVDALGRLLYGARDLAYSRSCIAEYFQRVRGEPPPAWLESADDAGALTAAPASAAPVSATPVNAVEVNAVEVNAVEVNDGQVNNGPVPAGQSPTAKPSPAAETGNSKTGASQSVPGQSEPQRGEGSE